MSQLGDPQSAPAVSQPTSRKKLLWAGRTVFDLVLDGTQTEGTIALLDQWGERGDATPLHVHRSEAEIFYVLEGGVTAWVADQEHTLAAGAAIYLPARLPHAFAVHTERARLISVTAPASFAGFVRQAGVEVDELPSTWDFDLGTLMAAAADHDIDIVGPPPQLPQ